VESVSSLGARNMQIFSSRCASKMQNFSSRNAHNLQSLSSRCARKIQKNFFALLSLLCVLSLLCCGRAEVYRPRHKHRQRIKRFKATKKKHTLTHRTFRSTDDDEIPTTTTDLLALHVVPSRTKMRRTYGVVARVHARYAHCPSVSVRAGSHAVLATWERRMC
jgi:hypothetical protein